MLEFPPLTSVCRADAAVVGGGWTGLLTARFLARQGMKIILLTEGRPGGDTSVLPATLLQPERFRRIAAHHGAAALSTHLRRFRLTLQALPRWLDLLAPYRSDDFYLSSRSAEEDAAMHAMLAFLVQHDIPAAPAPDAGGCPEPVVSSIRAPGLLIEAAPLAEALTDSIFRSGGQVFSHSRVLNASAAQVFTADGRVDADQVLLCTGKPLGLMRRSLLALLETHTLVHSRLQGPVPLHTAHCSVDPTGLTLLPVPGGAEALWIAGRTGSREDIQGTAQFLRHLQHRLPDWQAGPLRFRTLVRPADGLPVVGSFRAQHGCILCASGAEDFLSAVVCAQALARLALHHPASDDLLLRPDRSLSRRARRQMLLRLRRFRAISALRSTPRCAHCRCRLRYHAYARWWGCACCGSAFGLLGRRLAGPALSDADVSAAHRPGW